MIVLCFTVLPRLVLSSSKIIVFNIKLRRKLDQKKTPTLHALLCRFALHPKPRPLIMHPCNASTTKLHMTMQLNPPQSKTTKPSHIYNPLFLLKLRPPVSPPSSMTTPMPCTATLFSLIVPPSFLIMASLALAAPGSSHPNC